jgi:hypothetical protein
MKETPSPLTVQDLAKTLAERMPRAAQKVGAMKLALALAQEHSHLSPDFAQLRKSLELSLAGAPTPWREEEPLALLALMLATLPASSLKPASLPLEGVSEGELAGAALYLSLIAFLLGKREWGQSLAVATKAQEVRPGEESREALARLLNRGLKEIFD